MILLIGRTGAGKSSIAASLSKRHPELKLIAVGEALRHSRNPQVSKDLKAGNLVNDNLVTKIIIKTVKDLAPGQTPLLDGFPRRMSQVTQLELISPDLHRRVKRAIYLIVNPKTASARLSKRGRQDDVPKIIKRRVEVFEHETLPVVDYYRRQGLVTEVDGEGTITQVVKRLERVLGY